MTKKGVFYLISLIVLITFIYCCFKLFSLPTQNTHPDAIVKILETPAPKDNFEIVIEDNKLFLQNGDPFIFRGITSNYFRYKKGSTYFTTVEELLAGMEEVYGWGANTFQLYLKPELFNPDDPDGLEYMNELKQTIEWAYNKNVWIILNPVNDVRWEQSMAVRTTEGISRRDQILPFLSLMAKEFKDKENVLFGIEAEPKFIDDASVVFDRINAIKQYSNKPILIPFVVFSGRLNMTSFLLREKSLKNVIVDFHPYLLKNNDGPKGSDYPKDLNKYIDLGVYNTYPTILGEFGGFWQKDFNTEEDINYMMQVGLSAKKDNTSFIAYALDDFLIPIFNENGTINIRGLAIKELLKANAQ